MRESATAKAERLLLERRVTVEHRDQHHIRARVLGDHAVIHEVTYNASSGWVCSCPAHNYRTACSHTQAVQHVIVVGVDR